jgi:hypothetical protein
VFYGSVIQREYYRDDLVSVLVAYNSRPRKIFAPIPRNRETPGYVAAVLRFFRRIRPSPLRARSLRPTRLLPLRCAQIGSSSVSAHDARNGEQQLTLPRCAEKHSGPAHRSRGHPHGRGGCTPSPSQPKDSLRGHSPESPTMGDALWPNHSRQSERFARSVSG